MSMLHYFNITYCCDSDCLFCAANVGLIPHNGYTITASQFEQQLLNSHVKIGDRVIVSGGEPTLSPFFWEILDICDRHGCCIDLTTNGHFFSRDENVIRISRYNSLVVRIPLFGMRDEHDFLVGRKGSFDEAISALSNFKKIITNPGIILNVKFLLCKATVKSNPVIFDFLLRKYGTAFEYTLSPILVSRKAILNKEILLTTYTKMIEGCIDFVENEYINCDIIPLCVLPPKKMKSIVARRRILFEKRYTDAHEHSDNMNNFTCASCEICQYNDICDRFLPSYIEYFGTDEVRPF